METSTQVDLIAVLLPLLGVVFIIAVGVVLLYQQFQKSIFKQKLEKEALKRQHQQDLLRASIQVQEDERKRIAQDLHDELGAALSLSRMQLLQLGRQAEEHTEALVGVRELVEGAMASTRRITHELMPVQLVTMGLPQALQALADQGRQAGNITITATVTLPDRPLSWAAQLGIYRIVAELLNNTMKHAEATHVQLILLEQGDSLGVDYTDNGKGLPETRKGSGRGLQGLEGRATALGGTLSIGNRPEGGFHAHLDLPLSAVLAQEEQST